MPDLHSLLLAVDELETAAERPAVLLHHVGHDDREGPGLAVEGVDEAALSLLHGFLYEGEYGVDCVILLVEDIFLFFGPVDGEVLDSESLVHVGDGFGDGVYDVGDLVGDDELDVFGCELVADKQPVLDLDGAQEELHCRLGLLEIGVGLHLTTIYYQSHNHHPSCPNCSVNYL